jgi:four helix bundle protein
MNSTDLVLRTKAFAISCVKLADSIPQTVIGSQITTQLIRSSTSTAANYRASRLAHSRAAFTAKLSIVIEEADESEFWIDFGMSLGLLEKQTASPILQEAHELASIFIKSRQTIQRGKS